MFIGSNYLTVSASCHSSAKVNKRVSNNSCYNENFLYERKKFIVYTTQMVAHR